VISAIESECAGVEIKGILDHFSLPNNLFFFFRPFALPSGRVGLLRLAGAHYA
jgi:hypothetical protein